MTGFWDFKLTDAPPAGELCRSAREAKVFEIAEPFRVRVPNPFRHKAGEMAVDAVAFDGTVVRVTYHKAAQSFGWWCAKATHEFEWLAEVRTPDDAARHYADWLVEYHEQPLSAEQREQLRAGAEVVPAGRGRAVYLSAALAGWHIPGGKNWIYLLSAGGSHGALRIPDSAYQSYSFDRFEVLANVRRAVSRPRRPGAKRRGATG